MMIVGYYLIGLTLIAGVTALSAGYYKFALDDEESFLLMCGVALWPVVLALVIFVAPFVGLFVLGRHLRERRLRLRQ